MPRKIEISYRTIVFTTVFLLVLWLLFQIKDILLGLFISLILMSSLNPSVKRLEKLKIPRVLAILLLYLLIIAFFGLAIGGIIPPLVDQTSTLVSQVPGFFQQFKFLGIDEKLVASQFSQFTAIPINLVKFIFEIFSNIVAILGLTVITFYLLMERKNLDRYLVAFFGEGKEKEISALIDKIEEKLGGWVRGELLLMLFVGILSYAGFRIIGLDFALPLAILAFLFEVVPNIGPILASFPAILIGLTISPMYAITVAGWCLLVQQVENVFLVPKVMKKTAGINPLVSLLSLAVGFKIAGVGGAVLAIPTFLVFQVIVSEVFSSKMFKDKSL